MRFCQRYADVAELLAEFGAMVPPLITYASVGEFTPLYEVAGSFRRATGVTGVIPDKVATDGAAAYPPALATALSVLATVDIRDRIPARADSKYNHIVANDHGS